MRGGKRPLSARARADVTLGAQIQAIHGRSRRTYGVPRVHAPLAADGVHVGRKRVARLMRAADVQGVSRRKHRTTTRRDPAAAPAPDLVSRTFAAAGPDRLWVADITYIPTWAGFLYLAGVLDVWSRRVIGWAMATHLRPELVLDALNMAVAPRRPNHRDPSLRPGLPVHLDHLRAPLPRGRRLAVHGKRGRRLRQRPR